MTASAPGMGDVLPSEPGGAAGRVPGHSEDRSRCPGQWRCLLTGVSLLPQGSAAARRDSAWQLSLRALNGAAEAGRGTAPGQTLNNEWSSPQTLTQNPRP